jgi:hypothetical protein
MAFALFLCGGADVVYLDIHTSWIILAYRIEFLKVIMAGFVSVSYGKCLLQIIWIRRLQWQKI